MIDFACKTFDINEVIKCSLGLSRADYTIFEFFLDSDDWLTTEQISKKLKFNVSTVQRSVKKLFVQGILDRNQQNLDRGGYIFIYKIKSMDSLRKTIMGIVDGWVGKVNSELEKW